MPYAVLVDTTKCIGCRSCQVSCKQWNGLPAERTRLEGRTTGFQNPMALSAKTLTMVTNKEIEDPNAVGGMRWVFAKRQCMHCEEPACAAACPVTALHKTKEGPVTYDSGKCIGCRYCVWACPFGVPTADWESLAPKIHKCTMCFNRVTAQDTPAELNGKALTADEKKVFAESQGKPACVKACTTGALQFGDREKLLALAWERIKAAPGKYVSQVFGEKEVGGTSYLYISSVPFEKLGFRTDLGERPYPRYSKVALGVVSPAVMGLGGLLTAVYLLKQRKAAVSGEAEQGKKE
jgi:formate dehydrogenase iron-sulfur subunit